MGNAQTVSAPIFGMVGILWMILSPTKVVLAVNQTELDAMQAALDVYLRENDVHYNPANVYGLGEEFTAGIMRAVRTKYALSTKNKTTTPILFSPSEMELIQCRMEGYLEYCRHPFGGNASLTDVDPPYHADFIISDEPVSLPNAPDIQNFPLFVLGVAPFFNLPGIPELKLTRLTAAKIFRGCTTEPQCLPGSITQWNDSAIKATMEPQYHPILDSLGPIKVFIQLDESAATSAFRRALSSFDPDFNAQIGRGHGSDWNGTSHFKRQGSHGVYRGVSDTPGSIGYTSVNIVDDLDGNVEHAEIISADGSLHIHPESTSMAAAFEEIGLAFGNDGSSPDTLIVDLTNTLGRRAWPISQIAYIAMRLDEHSEHCMTKRSELLKFLEFIYRGTGLAETLFVEGFAPLTTSAGQQMLTIVQSKLRCNGELVYQYPPPKEIVTIQVDEALQGTVAIAGVRFTADNYVELNIDTVDSYINLKKRFTCLGNASCMDYTGGFMVLADENLSNYIVRDDAADDQYELFSMPYCAMATGFVHNFCNHGDLECRYLYRDSLVLDLETAALILDQRITYWNDSRIQTLNPDKVLPPQPIVVIAGPKTSSFHFDFVETIRRAYVPTFAYTGGGSGAPTYYNAWIDVALTPFSISFVPFNGTYKEGAHKVSLLNRQGEVIQPDTDAIEACTRDTYDRDANVFYMSSSRDPACWPLVQAYNLFMLKTIHGTSDARLAQFLYTEAVRDRTIVYQTANQRDDTTVLAAVGLGTLVDLRLANLNLDFAQQNFDNLESIVDFNGISVLRVNHDLNLIPETLIIVMYVLVALELACFAGLAVWIVIHRNRKLIRNSSPVFMFQVLLGAAIMTSTVIPLAQQDSYLIPRGMTTDAVAQEAPMLDAACVAAPVLFSLGFFITFSALFLKSWRLIRIFNNKKLRNLFLKDKQLLMYQLVVMVIVIVLNLIWAIQDPLVWRRFPVFIDTKQDLVVASIGVCYSRGGVYPAIPLLIGIMLVLVVGNYLSYLGRRIPTEFNESKWTAMAMVATLEAFTIGIPILALANSQPIPGFIIKSFSSLLVAGATVALVFVPKVAMAYGWGLIDGESNPWRFVKGDSGSGSNPAKKSQKDGAVAAPDSSNTKAIKSISPSLNSLVEGKVMVVNTSSNNVHTDSKANVQSANPFFSGEIMRLHRPGSKSKLPVSTSQASTSKQVAPSASPLNPKRQSKEFAGKGTSEALAKVLQDDPMRRRFRRYLQTLKMEENVRFWDSLMMFRMEPDSHRRFVSARAIIQTFVLDSSPLQVNLSSRTKDELMRAFNDNDKVAMGSIDFFTSASDELFEDLRQSDAFRLFLENDTFSQQDVFNNSKSDPTVGADLVSNNHAAPT